jgi:hypothetical protein
MMKTKPYEREMGKLPVLTLYVINQDLRAYKLHNWRLAGANGEPLASGTGEEYGAFKSAKSAWLNSLKTANAFGSKRFAFRPSVMKVPRLGADFVVLDDRDRPFLRVRRLIQLK